MTPSRRINIAVLIVVTATLLAGCVSAPSAPPVLIMDMRQIDVDRHRQRLAAVATDHTFPVGGLVERRRAP